MKRGIWEAPIGFETVVVEYNGGLGYKSTIRGDVLYFDPEYWEKISDDIFPPSNKIKYRYIILPYIILVFSLYFFAMHLIYIRM